MLILRLLVLPLAALVLLGLSPIFPDDNMTLPQG
jgi:hypothetical protein